MASMMGKCGVFLLHVHVVVLYSLVAVENMFNGVNAQSGATVDSRPVLSLLNVLPYPDNRSFAGWDRGLELVPAGRLAVEHINDNPDVLPDHRLELIDIESEACGLSLVTEGLVNSYRHLVDPHSTVLGVVGLFCSSVTDVMAPILDHPNIALLEIAGSTSPTHRSSSEYPLLYHTISSSAVFNEAAIKLMENFGWQRAALVHDSRGIYFITTIRDFIKQMEGTNPNFDIITGSTIEITANHISPVFDGLAQDYGRIVYASVTEPESAVLLCEAYKRGYIWPYFAYIFLDRTIRGFLDNETDVSCSQEELIVAMEGVFLLQYRLEPDPDTVLVSDVTYRDYREEYSRRLSNFAEERDMNLQDNIYANVLYDEVWAFALALTNSLERLNTLNITLADFRFGDSETTDIIQEELNNISFPGAIGLIRFNSQGEAKTTVDIFQVRNGEAIPVGVYLSNEGILNITTEIPNVPGDHFDVVVVLLPEWLAVVLFFICGMCFILTTINLLPLIIWRNRPEIKASSPYLSLLMFAGCYMIYMATVLSIYQQFGTVGVESTCIADLWLRLVGLNLIIHTLFVKMLRIYHLFHYFGKTSRFWSDTSLFLVVLALCCGQAFILTLWTTLDTPYLETYSLSSQPKNEVGMLCYSEYSAIFFTVSLSYIGIFLVLIVFSAIQTRHIKQRHQRFKDTKKVNAYIFSLVVISCNFPILFFAVETVTVWNLYIAVYCIVFLAVPVSCQLFLFVPKTVPLLVSRKPNLSVPHAL